MDLLPSTMIKKTTIGLLFSLFLFNLYSQDLLIEAESFNLKGGWQVDPQFVEEMGSPYLLAHGLGEPVTDATTEATLPESGSYHIWVRTTNWAAGPWKAPGRFRILINGHAVGTDLGTEEGWQWQYAGKTRVSTKEITLGLHDLTGFEGRCDAIYLSKQASPPPYDPDQLKVWRSEKEARNTVPSLISHFDLVVTGGGLAGCAASIAAAEQGLKVALIQDRPVLGGNASSEVRVHTLGIYGYFERILKMIDTHHYPNGSPESLADEQKRMANIRKYPNIHLFLNFRAYNANTDGNRIVSVDAMQTSSGKQIRFAAPLFVDCTGDGWIGYWAGAAYMYGREPSDKYEESWNEHGDLWSPDTADNRVMGASMLWRSYHADRPSVFPEVPWAMDVAGDYAAKSGEWTWEYSANHLNQAMDAETIRDHLFSAVYGSFYNEKQKPGNEDLKLEWVSSLAGKRESRRLKGDYIFTFKDVTEHHRFPDAVVMEDREVDVHYQQILQDTTKPDFLSSALFYKTDRYYIPYRCLYSATISNLFMAGRCFSCSHVGLGGPRVMRTTGQMGAAVGYAASVCQKYGIDPRDVFLSRLDEYMRLVKNSSTDEVPGL